ncbi:hypothetical protein AMAG_03674 [Allomyces macrogynus ATCC 38327]|uniref:Uncharacterized protein n=1 Tax=Allomyces macrogynus (strain ATCC 38327) TaxID=578462 RepID=A0A0L0SAG1_ALLM3|nr:hypothetical protein AMAG_03674 [Allomyces macrogynus ATCC 38327]|eukprot:KNE59390.1 hypothetical protein AMAG_03674 [Allomyces macrogynus ATCC 38327]
MPHPPRAPPTAAPPPVSLPAATHADRLATHARILSLVAQETCATLFLAASTLDRTATTKPGASTGWTQIREAAPAPDTCWADAGKHLRLMEELVALYPLDALRALAPALPARVALARCMAAYYARLEPVHTRGFGLRCRIHRATPTEPPHSRHDEVNVCVAHTRSTDQASPPSHDPHAFPLTLARTWPGDASLMDVIPLLLATIEEYLTLRQLRDPTMVATLPAAILDVPMNLQFQAVTERLACDGATDLTAILARVMAVGDRMVVDQIEAAAGLDTVPAVAVPASLYAVTHYSFATRALTTEEASRTAFVQYVRKCDRWAAQLRQAAEHPKGWPRLIRGLLTQNTVTNLDRRMTEVFGQVWNIVGVGDD